MATKAPADGRSPGSSSRTTSRTDAPAVGGFGFDAYAPREIAGRVEALGVAKVRLPLLTMIVLGVLAGGFIGLGALYYTVVTSDQGLGFAAGRVLGGIAFSLGLILVVIAGAELFTGNNLVIMAWVGRRVTTLELVRGWVIVFCANFLGAGGLVALVVLSHHWQMAGGAVGRQAVTIAAAKTALPFWDALLRGILCNILVCLAVWLALAGRSVADKILAIVFPISAFVAAGFEHSVANMYFIPLGVILRDRIPSDGIPGVQHLTWSGLAGNLLPVTLGNIIGGGAMVALVYYVVYLRTERPRSADPSA